MSDVLQFVYSRDRLLELAHRRGFETIQEYLESLIEDDLNEPDVVSDLREAFDDLKNGRYYPVEQLRRLVEDDSGG